MFETFTPGTRRAFEAAVTESRLRGDRRVGTDHLLIGLLYEPEPATSLALGVDLAAARAAGTALDGAALASIGFDVPGVPRLPGTGPVPAAPKRATLTSGARGVLSRAAKLAAASKGRNITTGHLVLALLDAEQPDPAAALLAELGVDRGAVRERLLRTDE